MSEERKIQLPALFVVPVLSQETVASFLGGQPRLGARMRALLWSVQPLLLSPKATSSQHSALSDPEGEPIPSKSQTNVLL